MSYDDLEVCSIFLMFVAWVVFGTACILFVAGHVKSSQALSILNVPNIEAARKIDISHPTTLTESDKTKVYIDGFRQGYEDGIYGK